MESYPPPAIGGLNSHREFPHFGVARTARDRATDGIELQPVRRIDQRVAEFSVVLIGKESADVFAQCSVLIKVHCEVCWRHLFGDRGVIDLSDGDGQMLRFSARSRAPGQCEGMTANLLLIRHGPEHPDRFTAIVEDQGGVVETHAPCGWNERWCEMQVDGFVRVLPAEAKTREHGLTALVVAQAKREALFPAGQGGGPKPRE